MGQVLTSTKSIGGSFRLLRIYAYELKINPRFALRILNATWAVISLITALCVCTKDQSAVRIEDLKCDVGGLGDRLVVGLRTLTPPTGVRVPLPHPIICPN